MQHCLAILILIVFNCSFYKQCWNALTYFFIINILRLDFPGGSDSRESTCNAGNPGLIPVSGRSLGEGNGYPLQYSFLENPMDVETLLATVHGVTKSQTQLSN